MQCLWQHTENRDEVASRKLARGACGLDGRETTRMRTMLLRFLSYIRPPLWSNGQSSWLQDWVRFQLLPDFLRSSGSERGPLSLVSTTEELLERKSSSSGLENREYGRRDPSRWSRGTLYQQIWHWPRRKAAVVRSRTQTTEYRFSFSFTHIHPFQITHALCVCACK
jgi:hypothetical protein